MSTAPSATATAPDAQAPKAKGQAFALPYNIADIYGAHLSLELEDGSRVPVPITREQENTLDAWQKNWGDGVAAIVTREGDGTGDTAFKYLLVEKQTARENAVKGSERGRMAVPIPDWLDVQHTIKATRYFKRLHPPPATAREVADMLAERLGDAPLWCLLFNPPERDGQAVMEAVHRLALHPDAGKPENVVKGLNAWLDSCTPRVVVDRFPFPGTSEPCTVRGVHKGPLTESERKVLDQADAIRARARKREEIARAYGMGPRGAETFQEALAREAGNPVLAAVAFADLPPTAGELERAARAVGNAFNASGVRWACPCPHCKAGRARLDAERGVTTNGTVQPKPLPVVTYAGRQDVDPSRPFLRLYFQDAKGEQSCSVDTPGRDEMLGVIALRGEQLDGGNARCGADMGRNGITLYPNDGGRPVTFEEPRGLSIPGGWVLRHAMVVRKR